MCRCVTCGAGEDLHYMEACNNCMDRFGEYLAGIYDAADITLTYVDGKFVFTCQSHMLGDCADVEELYRSLYYDFNFDFEPPV